MILTTAANIAGHRIVKTVRLVPATRSAPVMGRDIIAVSR